MAKRYKLWLCLEEYDTKTDEYQDLDEPEQIGPEFTSLKKAEILFNKLTKEDTE